jgi:hypothetical protein
LRFEGWSWLGSDGLIGLCGERPSVAVDPLNVRRMGRTARHPSGRDQRVVVVSDDFRVAVVSPVGDTVVPLESDRLVPLTTPLALDVCWLVVETEESDGSGATGVVVDCVVVELEDELSANAAPATSVTAIVATSNVLIMSVSPGQLEASGDRCAPCR